MCMSPRRCCCCNGLSSFGITRHHRYYAIVRLPAMHRLVLALLSLVPTSLSSLRDNAGSPGLPSIPNVQHAIVSDPGEQCSTYQSPCTILASALLTASPIPFGAFEAQSVQLSLTAYCLDCPVLNLWDYSRRPRGLYPVAGLPYRSGTSTRWNIRPCPAALGAHSRSLAGSLTCGRYRLFRPRGRAPTTIVIFSSWLCPAHREWGVIRKSGFRLQEGGLNRHPRSLLIGDLSPNIQALPLEGKDARLPPRA